MCVCVGFLDCAHHHHHQQEQNKTTVGRWQHGTGGRLAQAGSTRQAGDTTEHDETRMD